MKKNGFVSRWTARILVVALALAAPGPSATSAFAQGFRAPARVGGAAGRAGSGAGQAGAAYGASGRAWSGGAARSAAPSLRAGTAAPFSAPGRSSAPAGRRDAAGLTSGSDPKVSQAAPVPAPVPAAAPQAGRSEAAASPLASDAREQAAVSEDSGSVLVEEAAAAPREAAALPEGSQATEAAPASGLTSGSDPEVRGKVGRVVRAALKEFSTRKAEDAPAFGAPQAREVFPPAIPWEPLLRSTKQERGGTPLAAALKPASSRARGDGSGASTPAEGDAQEGLREPPAPSKAEPKPVGPGKGSLGKAALSFIGGLVVAQIGVEALGASMPTLVQKQFGDFTAVAQLAIFSSIAGIIGRQLAGVLIGRFGLKRTFLGSSALRLVSISALAGLLATGHMTLPLMMGFYSLNGLLAGVAVTAETSIPPALLDPKLPESRKQASLEKFWTWEQTLLEVIGIAGPIATGAVVASFGFLPALVAFPVTLAAALAWFAFTLRIPMENEPALAAKAAAAARAAAEEKPAPGSAGVFKEFFRKIGRGAKVVWSVPVLRTAFLAYTAYMMINPFLYSMLAPAYALRLVGAEHAELATAVGGWMTGLYSAGGLAGGLFMMREQSRIRKAREAGTMDDAGEAAALRSSLLKWMLLGTAGLAALASFVAPLPTLGALVALPKALAWLSALSLPALALLPFGVAQVVSTVKLRSLFQAKAPKEDMADAMGFLGSASLAVTTAGLVALKWLFKGFDGFAPFIVIAGSMVPLAVVYLVLRRRLARQTTTTPAP